MNNTNKSKLTDINYSSTPKRRRLGIHRIVRGFSRTSEIANSTNDVVTSTQICNGNNVSPAVFEDASPLPCNQMKYLHDTASTDRSCLKTIEECSIIETLPSSNSESAADSTNNVMEQQSHVHKEVEDLTDDMFQSRLELQEDFPDDMFQSRLELQKDLTDDMFRSRLELQEDLTDDMFQSRLELHEDLTDDMFQSRLELQEDLTDDMFQSRLELQETIVEENEIAHFKQSIVHSIREFNESICAIDNKKDTSIMFETKDSFLLNIKDIDFVANGEKVNLRSESNKEVKKNVQINNNNESNFYGLPLLAKTLFKMYRNIDKFYEWQEECLNLESVRNKRNLIYALPTSGGKTLVAEVLMMREVINNHRNALFVLPYVAIVQEKIWGLSPFAVQMDFLVEEYAAGKGHLPPKKRRKKNSIYIATIEKALALVRSLIELNRLNELGLIVVDELHLIGEPGRGGTLETLLTTVIFANQGIQIVGMSATIGNLSEIAGFLRAELYQRNFRPVDLAEYVKLGDTLHRFCWTEGGLELVPDRQLVHQSPAARALDPDGVALVVCEALPQPCLVFCATKRACENLAHMLASALDSEETSAQLRDARAALAAALAREGGAKLARAARAGVAYHHAGLAADERRLLEDAFRSGVLCVLCCTSTLAAGVNLPARRVVLRSPYVARQLLTLAAYRQMVGRAGRAGLASAGESILLCSEGDWPRVRSVLAGGLAPALSVLASVGGGVGGVGGGGGAGGVRALLLSAAGLGLAETESTLRELMRCTLLHAQADRLNVDIEEVCSEGLRALTGDGVLQATHDGRLAVTALGKAAMKGCMEVETAKRLCKDFELAAQGLVLAGSLHLLYLVTPHDVSTVGIRPDYRNYYSLYTSLDEEGTKVARSIGITEVNAIRMMTGKPISGVCSVTLARFYAALMLRDLWRQRTVAYVADKYMTSRGAVQALMSSGAAFAACAVRFCEGAASLWPWRVLLAELAGRLRHCAAPDLAPLLDLPAVKEARALQLWKAGYKRVEDVARASPPALSSSITHLSLAAATHLISAARMILIEKVENLRAEAEDVMDELNL